MMVPPLLFLDKGSDAANRDIVKSIQHSQVKPTVTGPRCSCVDNRLQWPGAEVEVGLS